MDENSKINEIIMNAFQTADVNNLSNAGAVYHSDSYFDN